MRSVLTAVVAALAGLVVWMAVEGWIIPPIKRGDAVRVNYHRVSPRFSPWTMFLGLTFVAVVSGLGLWLAL